MPANDFAWFASAPMLSGQAQVTIADGPSPLLHLHNPGTAPVSVTIGDETVQIPAGASVARPVAGGTTLQLGGFETLAATVTFGSPTGLAGYPALPPGAVSTPVTVYPSPSRIRGAGSAPAPGPTGPCRAARRPRGTRSSR